MNANDLFYIYLVQGKISTEADYPHLKKKEGVLQRLFKTNFFKSPSRAKVLITE